MPNQIITYKRPKLYPQQEAAFFNDSRYSWTEATTKAGKTVGGMAWLLEEAIKGREGQNFWWVAPVYGQAQIAYNRMKRGMTKGFLRPHGKLQLMLPNGADIWFKSGEKPDNLYGDDVYAAVIDEASRQRKESYAAIRTTTTKTRGKIRGIGNVKGRHNWFYQMCRKAEVIQRTHRMNGSVGIPEMEYHKITAADAVAAGILDPEEIEDARRNLPADVFKELYEAEPSDDGGNPFGYNAIQQRIMPMSTKTPKWFGWDLAKKRDWCVGIALDEDGNVCRFYRWQKPWQETMELMKLYTGTVQAFVDSTGVGDPILEALQRTHPNFEGYHFTSTSKQQLMEGLAVAIQQSKVGFPEGMIVMELEQFEYELTRTGVKYSAPEGFHDDCVCALALAQRRRTIPIAGMNILEYYDAKDAAEAATKK